MRRRLGWIVATVAGVAACEGGQGGPDAARDRDARAIDAEGDAGVDGPDGGFRWPVPTSSVHITPSGAWKSELAPNDPFVHPGDVDVFGAPSTARWVKFVVLMRDPSRVFFQDSVRYAGHHDFVREQLDPYLGRPNAAIDALARREAGQELIFGAVLFPPDGTSDELGIQLERQDRYHPEMARRLLAWVRARVRTGTAAQAYYFPSVDQHEAAHQDAAFFRAAGFPLGEAARWEASSACAVPGWAVGSLRALTASALADVVARGELMGSEILMVDEAPAVLPFVAGAIVRADVDSASALARVARARGVPLARVVDEEEWRRIAALADRPVVLRVGGGFGCRVRVDDATEALSADQRRELGARAAPRALRTAAKVTRGAAVVDVDGLGAADVGAVGGRVVRYAMLRESLGENTARAWAVTGDVWDAVMAQPFHGSFLGMAIRARLAAHSSDGPELRAALREVRAWIAAAEVPVAERAALTAGLSPLDPRQPVVLEPSTNVEDATFSDQALLASTVGCLADDTDGDAAGPSACDAQSVVERGLLAGLMSVYAGVFDDAAYLERRRRGVDEATVTVALLVRAALATPASNGIVALGWGPFSQRVQLTTQLGATPVGDRRRGARPEVVDADVFGGEVYPAIRARSSLVSLGETVLRFPDDYAAITRVALGAGERFAARSGRDVFMLELDQARGAAGQWVTYGLREVPVPDPQGPMAPTFLLGGALRRCTFQGESGDVFGNHRMKSRWTMFTRSACLGPTAPVATLFGEVNAELIDGGRVVREAGVLSARPGHVFGARDDGLTDAWTGPGRRLMLVTALTREVRAPEIPVLTLDDGYVSLEATWSQPVFELDFTGQPATRTVDYTSLGGCPEDAVLDGRTALVERRAQAGNRRVRVAFHHPPPPRGIGAGYTAPLHRWRETVLEGFTAAPIVLRGFWSQTYRPGHHNFSEEFIFEPRLEEGIPPAVLAELEAAGVRWIHVQVSGDAMGSIAVMAPDGTYRAL